MSSGERRIDQLGDMGFQGQVGQNIADYAKATQRLAHDMASELDTSAEVARVAMLQLRKHPLLVGVNVRLRSRLVARRLKRARDLAQAISAEAVKFNMQYRREFLDLDHRREPSGTRDNHHKYVGKVDL